MSGEPIPGVRGRPLPDGEHFPSTPAAGSPAAQGDDILPLTRSHAAGRPAHASTSGRVASAVYAVVGTALVWLALYGLAVFLFGETGRAVVLYLLTVLVLVSLAGVGFVLLGAAIGVEDQEEK